MAELGCTAWWVGVGMFLFNRLLADVLTELWVLKTIICGVNTIA
jgi:hypothetical protein